MSDSGNTDILLSKSPTKFCQENGKQNEIQYLRYDKNFKILPLTPTKRCRELEQINIMIHELEQDSSQMSPISNCITPLQLPFNSKRDSLKCNANEAVYSTPKTTCSQNDMSDNIFPYARKNTLDTFYTHKTNTLDPDIRNSCFYGKINDESIVSLEEILTDDYKNGKMYFSEETFRRQHLEKIIQGLQNNLLEYQQKIAIAVEIDKVKSNTLEKQVTVISKLRKENNELSEKAQNLQKNNEECLIEAKAEKLELEKRKAFLENELAGALSLVTKYQINQEIIESKINEFNKKPNEVDILYQNINKLNFQIDTYHKEQETTAKELIKIKSQLALKEKESDEKYCEMQAQKEKLEASENEIKTLKQQNNELLEKFKTEKNFREQLLAENVKLKENIDELTKKEEDLLQRLETQRASLKVFYQNQIENAVAQKLKQFQTQLLQVQENLQREAREREKLITDRAIKQIDVINQKNEEELYLIQKKQAEEIELYRIQLANSSQAVKELQEKIHFYKTRRKDLAQKLHVVMETQWRKALEILTTPDKNTLDGFCILKPYHINERKLDGLPLTTDCIPENESFESISRRNRKKNENFKTDMLQSFIEVLLSKSPNDLDGLNEVIRLSQDKSRKEQITKACNEIHRKSEINKPPWK